MKSGREALAAHEPRGPKLFAVHDEHQIAASGAVIYRIDDSQVDQSVNEWFGSSYVNGVWPRKRTETLVKRAFVAYRLKRFANSHLVITIRGQVGDAGCSSPAWRGVY
jgi:hypothetical protein